MLAANSVMSSIPDISGNWVGETFGGNGYVGPCNHFLYLEQSGNSVTGTSKTYCPGVFNKQELTGSISDRIFTYTGKTVDKTGSLSTPDMIFRFSIIGTPPNKLDGTASSQFHQGFVYVTMNRETPLTQSTPVQTTLPTALPTTAPPITQIPVTETPSSTKTDYFPYYPAIVALVLIIIGSAGIAYLKFVRKPKSSVSVGHGIQVPSSYKGGISGTVNHDIIISYSTLDKPIADAVCAGLEARGIRCWIAPRDILPGVNYQEGIIDAINSSKIMVLIFSSHANESPHVIREATVAMSKKVIIIPFRIDDSPLSKTMEFIISVPHWLEAVTPPLEKHIGELADTIIILLENERKKQKME